MTHTIAISTTEPRVYMDRLGYDVSLNHIFISPFTNNFIVFTANVLVYDLHSDTQFMNVTVPQSVINYSQVVPTTQYIPQPQQYYHYIQPQPPMAVRVYPEEEYDSDEDYYIYPSETESDSEYEDYELFSPVESPYNPEMGQIIDSLNNDHVQVMVPCAICYTRQQCVTFLGCSQTCVCKVCLRGLQITAKGEGLRCPLCNLQSGYIVGRLP